MHLSHSDKAFSWIFTSHYFQASLEKTHKLYLLYSAFSFGKRILFRLAWEFQVNSKTKKLNANELPFLSKILNHLRNHSPKSHFYSSLRSEICINFGKNRWLVLKNRNSESEFESFIWSEIQKYFIEHHFSHPFSKMFFFSRRLEKNEKSSSRMKS